MYVVVEFGNAVLLAIVGLILKLSAPMIEGDLICCVYGCVCWLLLICKEARYVVVVFCCD